MQLLLQGSFKQEEVKQPHRRDTQRPNIMNYLVTPEVPDHLPLATLSCLPEKSNHCGKNFSRMSSLSKHMLVVHGASRPSKILQDRYLAKLMALRWISFVICYIAFKTRISFKKHMQGVLICWHLDQKMPRAVCEGICAVSGGDQCGRTKHMSERGFTPVKSLTRLSWLCKC